MQIPHWKKNRRRKTENEEYGFTVSLGVGLQDGFLAHTQCYERRGDVFLKVSAESQ